MNSTASFLFDDKDLDDAALWAVIDSAAAASLSSAITSPASTRIKPLTPIPFPLNSSKPQLENRGRSHHSDYNHNPNGEVVQNHRTHKIPRTASSPRSSPQQLMVVKHVQRTPTTPSVYSADKTEVRNLLVMEFYSLNSSSVSCEKAEARHSLAGQFPIVSLFKDYQNAAMAARGRYHFTSISLLKLKTRPLSSMRIAMFSVLSLLFVLTCKVGDFQTDGVLVNEGRKSP